MKYLRGYKLFEGNVEAGDIKFLNHDLIADLKDLCMEEFDNGHALFLYFYINGMDMPCGNVVIGHHINDYNWHGSLYNLKLDYAGKVKYGFRFLNEETGGRSIEEQAMAAVEIVIRINNMYPKEDINFIKL